MPRGTPNLPQLNGAAPIMQQERSATTTAFPPLVPTSTPLPVITVTPGPTLVPVNANGVASSLVPINPCEVFIDPAIAVRSDWTYIYAPVISFADALSLLGIDENAIQTVEMIYRITLNDSTVANIHIMSIPEGNTSSDLIRVTFPGARIIASYPVTYQERTFVVTALDNGVIVLLDSASPTLIYLTIDDAFVSPVLQGQPTVMLPSARELIPTVIAPTVVPPASIDITPTATMPQRIPGHLCRRQYRKYECRGLARQTPYIFSSSTRGSHTRNVLP